MAFATATALAVVTAAKGISEFAGQRKSATAATREADYAAGMMDQNADLAEEQAADALVRGKKEEYKLGSQTRQLIGSQRSSLAGQGISIDSGSALDIQLESAGLGAHDIAEIRNNAAREAYGFRAQAADYRNRAKLTRYAGKNAASALRDASYGTLLTTATSLYDIKRKK